MRRMQMSWFVIGPKFKIPCQLLLVTVGICLLHYLVSLLIYSPEDVTTQKDPTPVATTPRPLTTTRPPTIPPYRLIFDGLRDSSRFIKPRSPNFYNVWQVVDDPRYEIYLYSAFYDDRPGLPSRMVRVIAIIEEENRTLFCLLWDRNSNTSMAVRASRVKTGAAISRHGKVFEPVILSCEIQDKVYPPEHVSIITVNSYQPSTLLIVQIPDKPPEPLEFGTCVSVSYWMEDPYRIIEWLELHRLWGVQEVTVYNNSLSAEVSRTFMMYHQAGFVDFRQAPSAMPDEGELTILLNMSPTLNDCMYRNMYRYKKLVVTDFDELIVPRLHTNYQEMISAIDKVQPSLHPQRSYMFRNVYFFLDFPASDTEPWYLTSTRYRRRIEPSEYGYSVKSITDPLVCVALQNHLCWKIIDKHNTAGWLIDVNLKYGMNHHYKFCHFDKYLKQPGKCREMMREETTDDTMLRFMDQINTQVGEKMWMLDLDGSDDYEEENVTMENTKHGALATNEEEAREIQNDFKEMDGNSDENGRADKTGENKEEIDENESAKGEDSRKYNANNDDKNNLQDKDNEGNINSLNENKDSKNAANGSGKSSLADPLKRISINELRNKIKTAKSIKINSKAKKIMDMHKEGQTGARSLVQEEGIEISKMKLEGPKSAINGNSGSKGNN